MAKAVQDLASPEVKEVSVKEKNKSRLQKFMEDETRLVKGRFRSYQNPGSREKIYFKKYPTRAEMSKRGESGGVEPFEKWMVDNEVYEIPLYVARHLNGTDITAEAVNGKINSCAYPIHSFMAKGNDLAPCQLDAAGIPVPVLTSQKYERRFGFESLEFGT